MYLYMHLYTCIRNNRNHTNKTAHLALQLALQVTLAAKKREPKHTHRYGEEMRTLSPMLLDVANSLSG